MKDRLASAFVVYFIVFFITSCWGWSTLVSNPTPGEIVFACHLVGVSLVSLSFCFCAGYALFKLPED